MPLNKDGLEAGQPVDERLQARVAELESDEQEMAGDNNV